MSQNCPINLTENFGNKSSKDFYAPGLSWIGEISDKLSGNIILCVTSFKELKVKNAKKQRIGRFAK